MLKVKDFSFGRVIAGLATATALLGLGERAEALTVGTIAFDAFLIGEQSVAPDGTVSGSSVYQFNGLGNRLTTPTLVTGSFDFSLGTALDIESYTDPYDVPNIHGSPYTDNEIAVSERPLATSYLESEAATLNGDFSQPDNQINLGRATEIVFDLGSGITDFILAELGGINPFELRWCPTAACTSVTTLFQGINSAATDFLLGASAPAFSVSDGDAAVDQTWLLRFSTPLAGFLQVVENDNRGTYQNERLAIDYAGAVFATSAPAVPGPASLPLMAGGLGLLVWLRRRKTA